MRVEAALFFESVEEIYSRVFRTLKPHSKPPKVEVNFRKYANANSRIKLQSDCLTVNISDLLKSAPAPIQEALAFVLVSKLLRGAPDRDSLARFRRYINGAPMREILHAAKRERGRKIVRDPRGLFFDLNEVFDTLNAEHFHNKLRRPHLGWSIKRSQTTLGHYDPSHHTIVISHMLDSKYTTELVLSYVMFHEMLHIQHPVEHTGSRRCVHTREFKEAERKFPKYAEAKAALRRLLASTARARQSEVA
jgi:hypothetical protein